MIKPKLLHLKPKIGWSNQNIFLDKILTGKATTDIVDIKVKIYLLKIFDFF